MSESVFNLILITIFFFKNHDIEFKFQIIIKPHLFQFFKIPLFSRPVASFFSNLIHDSMNTRAQDSIVRPDMIHLLMLAKKGSLKYDNDQTVLADNTGFATIQQASLKQSTIKRGY